MAVPPIGFTQILQQTTPATLAGAADDFGDVADV
jgi:hypothetical protein